MSVTDVIWSVLALAALLLVGLALRAERRRFAARGKAGAWLWVRLASLPIGLAAAAAVWLPARAVGGPEALAAFYLLMFSLGPLVYFGLHWLAGRMATPALSGGESAAIGGSGLLLVIFPALLASMAAPWVHQLGLGAQQAQRSLAAETPLAHRILDRRRFLLPDIGEVLTEHWQAPPGVKVERIEWELGGQYLQTGDSTGSILCRDGEDFHVFRLAAAPAPRWRMYWRDMAGSTHRSDWTSAPPESTPQAGGAPGPGLDAGRLRVSGPHPARFRDGRTALGLGQGVAVQRDGWPGAPRRDRYLPAVALPQPRCRSGADGRGHQDVAGRCQAHGARHVQPSAGVSACQRSAGLPAVTGRPVAPSDFFDSSAPGLSVPALSPCRRRRLLRNPVHSEHSCS
jgi:hypothetical protein